MKIYDELAIIYRQLKKPDKLVAVLKRRLELNPKDSTTQLEIARVYFDAKRYEEAIPELQKHLEMDPDANGSATNLGIAYWKTGEYSASVKTHFGNFFSLLK